MNIEEFNLNIPLASYKNSHFISILRPWINVGNVGHNAISRLVKIFDLEEIGRLKKPSKYYDMTRYRPEILEENGERKVRVPNTVIFGNKIPSDRNIFLLYMLEPHNYAEDYNDAFIDLIKKLNGQRYTSIGGMFDSVPHTRPLPVTGSYKGWIPPSPLDQTLKRKSNYVGPTSMTSQLSQILSKEFSIETLSLMVHIPLYIKLEDDFLATYRLLETLSKIYNYPIDLPEREKGEKQYKEIHKNLEGNSQVTDLIKQFEANEKLNNDELGLSPKIEDFLKDLEDN
ncbi:MAG: PAC2 family protein [Dehalococcoidia bacterium]|nr:PAC2 family protein [Dehalococcoidia bacterium]